MRQNTPVVSSGSRSLFNPICSSGRTYTIPQARVLKHFKFLGDHGIPDELFVISITRRAPLSIRTGAGPQTGRAHGQAGVGEGITLLNRMPRPRGPRALPLGETLEACGMGDGTVIDMIDLDP